MLIASGMGNLVLIILNCRSTIAILTGWDHVLWQEYAPVDRIILVEATAGFLPEHAFDRYLECEKR
jgi:hypothetical protein